ncbi:hypothetical protein KA005_28270 [bacterium]|nr:hypothetical protein [bacterium]
MARDAMGKLSEADELNKTAARIRKRDPVNARKLDNLAGRKRNSAIRQMSRSPKRRKSSRRITLSG